MKNIGLLCLRYDDMERWEIVFFHLTFALVAWLGFAECDDYGEPGRLAYVYPYWEAEA